MQFLKPNNFLNKLAWLAFLSVLSINYAFADDKKLTIGGLEFPPYIINEDSGVISGIMVDFIREAAADRDVEVSFNITNWARALKEVQTGRADAIIPTMYSKDREAFLFYPEQELFTLNMVFFKHQETDIDFSGDYGSLKNYTIGKLRNARVSPEFDKAVEDGLLKVDERSSVTTLMRAVARKRLKLVALDYPTGMWVLKNENLTKNVKVLSHSLGRVKTFLAFAKDAVSQETILQLNSSMENLVENGRRQEILRSYIYKN